MPLELEDLEKFSGIDKELIEKAFIKEYGFGPITWLTFYRVFLGAELMRFLPKYSDEKIGSLIGFVETQSFRECFFSLFEISTTQYKETMSKLDESEDYSSINKLLTSTRGTKNQIFLRLEESAYQKMSSVYAS